MRRACFARLGGELLEAEEESLGFEREDDCCQYERLAPPEPRIATAAARANTPTMNAEMRDLRLIPSPPRTWHVARGVTVAPTNSGLLSCLGNQRELRRNYGMWTTAGQPSGRRAITRQPLNAGRTHCAHAAWANAQGKSVLRTLLAGS